MTTRKNFGDVALMVVRGYVLLTMKERLAASGIALGSLVASVVEFAALSMVVPFVALVMGQTDQASYRVVLHFAGLVGLSGGKEMYLPLGLSVIAGLVVAFACRMAVNYFVERFSVRFTNRLVQETMRGCLYASYQWLRSQNGAQLAQHISTDSLAVGQNLYPVVLELIYGIFIAVIGVGAIVFAAPGQALWVILALAVLGIGIVSVLNPVTAHFAGKTREHGIASGRVAVEGFAGRKLIKASRAENFFAQRYETEIEKATNARLKLNVINKMIPSMTLVLGQVGMLSLAIILIYANFQTEDVVGYLTFILLVLSRVLPSVSSITGALNKLTKTEPFFRGFMSLRKEIHPWCQPVGAKHGAIAAVDWRQLSLEDVAYRYPGAGIPQIVELSCRIERGRSYGIVGPSGAGKSTMLDLILGLLAPEKGVILLDGRALDGKAKEEWLVSVGYVPQDPYILDDSVRRNVAFALPDKEIDDVAVWRALTQAELAETIQSWPDGIDTNLGEGGSRLSGGQRQRVAIARALYRGATLIVLDEATNALDSITEDAINTTVRNISSVTSLLVAHRVSALQECDEIFLLDGGRLIDKGPYSGLAKRSALFRALARERSSAA